MPVAARIIPEASGKNVVFDSAPIEAVRRSSKKYVVMLEWFDRVGYTADIAEMACESGIKRTRFSEWARKVTW